MKKFSVIGLVASTILFICCMSINYNVLTVDTTTQVSYIPEESFEEFNGMVAKLDEETLVYNEENNVLRKFAGVSNYSKEEISFEYTSTWQEVDMAEIEDPTFLINGRNAVFNIVKEDIPENFTLDDYIKSTVQVLENEENINITYKEKVTVNNMEGFNLVYTITDGDKVDYLNQFCTIKNNKVYVFSYYSQNTDYEKYLSEFQGLLTTLTINNL